MMSKNCAGGAELWLVYAGRVYTCISLPAGRRVALLSAAFTGAAAERRLPANEGGGEGCSLCSCTKGDGLHGFIVLHRAFLPCSLTCSVTNYSLIAGWQKKSFTALRLFLTNQVTEALKIILSRKEAP